MHVVKLIILFAPLLMFLSSCENVDNQIEVELKLKHEYGEKEGERDEILGRISDFCFDRQSSMYIIDRAFHSIKMFNKNDELVKIIELKKGRGPGGLDWPVSIGIDSLGNIYLADQSQRKVVIFDKENNFIREFKLNLMPSQLIVESPFIVFVLGYPYSTQNELIHKYDLSTEGRLNLLTKFCSRYDNENNEATELSGYAGYISYNEKDKHLLYTFTFPYEIRQFTNDGKLIKVFKKEGYYKEPSIEFRQGNPLVIMEEASLRVMEFNNGLIGNLYFVDNDDNADFYLDVIDLKKMKVVSKIYFGDLGIYDRIHRVKVNENGLFISINSQYPRILKYEYKFSNPD